MTSPEIFTGFMSSARILLRQQCINGVWRRLKMQKKCFENYIRVFVRWQRQIPLRQWWKIPSRCMPGTHTEKVIWWKTARNWINQEASLHRSLFFSIKVPEITGKVPFFLCLRAKIYNASAPSLTRKCSSRSDPDRQHFPGYYKHPAVHVRSGGGHP